MTPSPAFPMRKDLRSYIIWRNWLAGKNGTSLSLMYTSLFSVWNAFTNIGVLHDTSISQHMLANPLTPTSSNRLSWTFTPPTVAPPPLSNPSIGIAGSMPPGSRRNPILIHRLSTSATRSLPNGNQDRLGRTKARVSSPMLRTLAVGRQTRSLRSWNECKSSRRQ